MRKMKENVGVNSGITLVALAITIIVLLILAGVTLNTLIGEGGIINRAKEAKEQTNLNSVKEEVQLILTEAKMELINEGKANIMIQDVAQWIRNNKDNQIDMTIIYKSTASVIIEQEQLQEDKIDYAEIKYKGYTFILEKNLIVTQGRKQEGEINSTYTITFDTNGGNIKQESKTIKYNEEYGKLEVPEKIGYTFEGWYTRERRRAKNRKYHKIYNKRKSNIICTLDRKNIYIR